MQVNFKILGFSHVIEDVSTFIRQIDSLTSDPGVIQLLDADGVAGEEHVNHAVHQAVNSFKRKDNIANDLGLEICVRASAQRQISKALELLGLKKGYNNICAVLVDCDKDTVNELQSYMGEINNKILEPDITSLKEIYNVSDEEMKSSGGITRVMIERTSLLVLETW
ncbi:MAG: KEOPS complex subunit Cgi121 [Methanobacterium sp.]|nr:KEOPS complex subunit Cgi121 [Methanobacterium sp.]